MVCKIKEKAPDVDTPERKQSPYNDFNTFY